MNWGQRIGDWIERRGFVTISLFARVYPEISRKGHESHFAKEVKKGRIKAFGLKGREQCFILTGRECKARGLHSKRARPYGAQSLITHYGHVLYAVERSVDRFTRAEIAERAPELLVPGLSHDRYVPLDGGVLGLLLVDCGSDVRHLARKVRTQVERRRSTSDAWKEITRLRAFRVIVIVAHPQKAKRLRKILNNWGGEFEVLVFEELDGLIEEKTR